jgi:pyruvate-ferredoxin/flavodoxin oxidoreductase
MPTRAANRGLADYLVRKSVWIVGGDGWAYDIGYGGLDHVLASGRDVNILVLDTEVYSNTGGQASKATRAARWPSSPPAASALRKKDLGMIAMPTATSTWPASRWAPTRQHALKAFREAEAYPARR